MNTKLIKGTTILVKICEILVWMATGVMFVVGVLSFIFGNIFEKYILEGINNGTITIDDLGLRGESLTSLNMVAIGIAFIFASIAMTLVAMIFRNIGLIFKKEAPFCEDNIRMVREIGIFAISLPIVQIIFSLFLSIGVGPEAADLGVDGKTLIFGIVVLALSQYFRYGAELEKDVDGLL